MGGTECNFGPHRTRTRQRPESGIAIRQSIILSNLYRDGYRARRISIRQRADYGPNSGYGCSNTAQPRPEASVNVSDLFRQNMQPIYFDYDKAEIRPDQISRLQADASWLKSHRGLKFKVEGNCEERGSEE